MVVRRMPLACTFSPGSKQATEPSSPRAAMTETSRSKVDEAFEDGGRACHRGEGGGGSSGAMIRACPLPS